MPSSTAPSRRYVLITPCRDEAEFLPATIASVAGQTILPAKWVIVDDGSTDQTPRILAEAAARYPYIHLVRRTDRGVRSVGPGVIEAFYAGLAEVEATLDQYDYLAKFDGDLEFGPRYFERLMEHCEADAWLGTVSGKLFLRYGSQLVEERCGDENSVGPSKFYRVQCFRDIGGFVRQVSWDGIDGHMCRLRGWVARSINEPDMQLIHLRRMGSSQKSFWTGRLRWGRGKYFMGSSLLYVMAVSFYRLFERPYGLSGIGILCGYMQAAFKRMPRFEHPEYRRVFRRFEFNSLFMGKRRAMNREHDRVRRDFPPPDRRQKANQSMPQASERPTIRPMASVGS